MATRARAPEERISILKSIPFVGVHVAAVVGIWLLGFSWSGLALAVGLYYLRMFGVTAGYHRYFSHRTYKTSRPFQLLLALLAMSSSQKGVLWWASHHRVHHANSDKPTDVHSVVQDGFLWGHVGWILSFKHEHTDVAQIRDLQKYPELRFLDRFWVLPPFALAVLLFAVGGAHALVWGFFVSTSLLWHGTFTINSLSHMFGRRRYATSDNSKNSLVLALVTMGEGWHNNHHYYARSTRQGFYWWEIDLSFYALKALAAVGLVWDLHEPSAAIRDRNHVAPAASGAPAVTAERPSLPAVVAEV